jgi:hypothetical protein
VALVLVLQDFETELAGHRFRFGSGDVIDDAVEPVAQLVPMGLATLPYNAGTMAAPVATFLEAHGRDEPRPSIIGWLLTFGAVMTGTALRGAGNPNGITTGNFSQRYFDDVAGVWYACDSAPTGTNWTVL